VLAFSIGSSLRKDTSTIGKFSLLIISFAGLNFFSKCSQREGRNLTAAGGRFALNKGIYVLCKTENGYLSDYLFDKIKFLRLSEKSRLLLV
jgi:hypothetical protein